MRIPLLVTGALILACSHVASAAVYRCADGSFQDKPCDKGDGKVISKRNTAGKPRPPDDVCVALGLDAAQIAKTRADGGTSEAQIIGVDKEGISSAEKLARKKLIVDVYQKTGTPQEIGIIFEADCVKAREAAKMQLPAPAPRQDAVPESAGRPASIPNPADAEKRAVEQRKLAAEQKKSNCDSLQMQREGVMSQQRAGGSIPKMESLNRTRQDIDRQISAAGCI